MGLSDGDMFMVMAVVLGGLLCRLSRAGEVPALACAGVALMLGGLVAGLLLPRGGA